MKPTYCSVLTLGLPLLLVVASAGAAVHFRAQAVREQGRHEVVAREADVLRARLAGVAAGSVEMAPMSGPVNPALASELEDALRRIRDLEQQLEAQEQRIAALRRDRRFAPDGPLAGDELVDPRRRDRRDWMEELREEDPERHAARLQRREEVRQRVQDSFARKAAHFLDRDQAAMSAGQRAEYEAMLGLLGDTWHLADRLQSDQTPREERGDIRRELMHNARILRPMLEHERDQQFYELGRRLGYNESGAVEFVDYLTEMIEITSFGSIWQGGRGGRGPGGGR